MTDLYLFRKVVIFPQLLFCEMAFFHLYLVNMSLVNMSFRQTFFSCRESNYL